MASEHTATPVEQVFKRDPFPSLSLMSRPVTPAPPRIRLVGGKYGCRVELRDIARHKKLVQPGLVRGPVLSFDDYMAPAAEGWGNSRERAYNAWRSKWRDLFERSA